MLRKVDDYQDLAVVIAWPDQTAYGDEAWMSIFKKLGIVKNLNFRVGHAAIVLVHRASGRLSYYDFGRYVAPRGYGRARSVATDPRLSLDTVAKITKDSRIANLKEILAEIEEISHATHSEGRIFCSVAKDLSYGAATEYAQSVLDAGLIKYGAFARANKSCSRFVAKVLLAGYAPKHPAKRHVFVPECLKPSPMSNVVNSTTERTVFCYYRGQFEQLTMDRYRSFIFQLRLIGHNFFSKKAALLPCDKLVPGLIDEPERPSLLPECTQWLGGINEGAWFSLAQDAMLSDSYTITRFNSFGEVVYHVSCLTDKTIDPRKPFQFTYHCDYNAHTILQGKDMIRFRTIKMAHDITDVS